MNVVKNQQLNLTNAIDRLLLLLLATINVCEKNSFVIFSFVSATQTKDRCIYSLVFCFFVFPIFPIFPKKQNTISTGKIITKLVVK